MEDEIELRETLSHMPYFASRPTLGSRPTGHEGNVSDTDRIATVPPARHLLRAKDLVDARYFEPIGVVDMARAARLSRAHFSRAFRDAFGESPHRYLLTRRLERAAALLRTTDRKVADICFMVGLGGVGSFTTSFRRMFDMTPTAYRAAHPPAGDLALVPACVVRAYARPQNRTFREDSRPPRPYVAPVTIHTTAGDQR
jgi:AraC-like DNA-binding protein